MKRRAHITNTYALILVLAFGTCFVFGCDLADFPEKGTFLDRSFDGSFICPPNGEREPDFVSHFKLELLNRTVCQFLGYPTCSSVCIVVALQVNGKKSMGPL